MRIENLDSRSFKRFYTDLKKTERKNIVGLEVELSIEVGIDLSRLYGLVIVECLSFIISF